MLSGDLNARCVKIVPALPTSSATGHGGGGVGPLIGGGRGELDHPAIPVPSPGPDTELERRAGQTAPAPRCPAPARPQPPYIRGTATARPRKNELLLTRSRGGRAATTLTAEDEAAG